MLLRKAQHVGTDFYLTAPYVVPAEHARHTTNPLSREGARATVCALTTG
jgi:hypothetical protein